MLVSHLLLQADSVGTGELSPHTAACGGTGEPSAAAGIGAMLSLHCSTEVPEVRVGVVLQESLSGGS